MTRPSHALGNPVARITPGARRLRSLPSPTSAPHWPESTRFSLLENLLLDDFRLTTQLPETTLAPSTSPDLWLVFGYLDADNFYLVHLQPSETSCRVDLHLVTASQPIPLAHAMPLTPGRSIRLERSLRTGGIHVLLDGSPVPVLSAVDHTYASGQLGIASTPGTWSKDAIDLQGILASPLPLQSAS